MPCLAVGTRITSVKLNQTPQEREKHFSYSQGSQKRKRRVISILRCDVTGREQRKRERRSEQREGRGRAGDGEARQVRGQTRDSKPEAMRRPALPLQIQDALLLA